MFRNLFDKLRRVERVASVAPYRPVREEKPAAPPVAAPKLTERELPPVTHRKASPAGIALMHQFEGCARKRPDGRFEAYPDPGSVDGHPWTIGWGSTGPDPFNGGSIRKGTVWTQAECDLRFEQHLAKFEDALRGHLGKTPTTQPQFDAMLSLIYNIGSTAFGRSTVLRRHKQGDYPAAANAFLMWVKNDGRVMKGLVRRREAEAALYRKGSK